MNAHLNKEMNAEKVEEEEDFGSEKAPPIHWFSWMQYRTYPPNFILAVCDVEVAI